MKKITRQIIKLDMMQLKGRKDTCGTSRRLEHVYNQWKINIILIVWVLFYTENNV